MKKIDLGNAAQTIATIGVIGGLALLAFELHQNNTLLETQANLELAQNRIYANELLATNVGLASIITRGTNGETLIDTEIFMLEAYYDAVFTKWAWEHGQYLNERISEDKLPVGDWQHLMRTWPNVRDFWSRNKERGRTVEFVQFMDANVVDQ